MNNAMKTIGLALSAVLASTLVAGCAVDSGGESDGQAEQANQPALEAQSGGQISTTLYYSNASQTTQVGRCVFSTCPGSKGRRCTGQQTIYYEEFVDSCIP